MCERVCVCELALVYQLNVDVKTTFLGILLNCQVKLLIQSWLSLRHNLIDDNNNSNNNKKQLSPFSPQLNKHVTTGGSRHLNRLKVALRG